MESARQRIKLVDGVMSRYVGVLKLKGVETEALDTASPSRHQPKLNVSRLKYW